MLWKQQHVGLGFQGCGLQVWWAIFSDDKPHARSLMDDLTLRKNRCAPESFTLPCEVYYRGMRGLE